MNKLASIPKVLSVVVLPPYGLRLTFDDGLRRDVDLTDELWGPVFEPLRDPGFFAQVAVDHGTVVWPNGVDLDPVVLHGDAPSAGAKPGWGRVQHGGPQLGRTEDDGQRVPHTQ